MLPTLVLVGRPNVGKSTLFNRLTRTRDALVADYAGLTRDRHYGRARIDGRPYLVVDTGGFEPTAKDGIFYEMAKQTHQALAEADCVVFITDGRHGLTPRDRGIAELLRRGRAPVILAVNKCEGMREDVVTAEFHELALGHPHAISAAHGEGVHELVEAALANFHEDGGDTLDGHPEPRIAIVGRPNVGKSTLVNAYLGEERVIAFDQPGTTRDSIYVEFEHGGRPYTLIDTAGLRRRGKVFEAVEKFSVVKTMQAIEDANVVILVLDAGQDISDQDAHIAGHILETGRSLTVAVNKWDGLDSGRRQWIKTEVERRLGFLDFADFHYISAAQGLGLGAVMKSVDRAFAAATASLPTPKLTRTLIAATTAHAPPKAGPFRPKLRYAHQGGSNPPLVIVHGSAVAHVPDSYRRYLENTFREAFELHGTPLRVELRQGHNPFAGRKPPPMTAREENRARRERRYRRKTFG